MVLFELVFCLFLRQQQYQKTNIMQHNAIPVGKTIRKIIIRMVLSLLGRQILPSLSSDGTVNLSQYEPAEHPLVPQIQTALFGSFPLIFVHSGADRQRQKSEWAEEQDIVEEESGL